jgi:hypothetical protein
MPWRFSRNAMHEAKSITRNLKNGAGFWRRETRRPPATVPMHCASGAFPKFDHIGVIPGTERSEGTGNPYVDGPLLTRGAAARGSDRLRSYVRSVDAVAHDRCQDGFRDVSSEQDSGFECHWVPRSVLRLGSIDRTICCFSSKRRPQREAMVALTPNSLWVGGRRGRRPQLAAFGARGAARSPT